MKKCDFLSQRCCGSSLIAVNVIYLQNISKSVNNIIFFHVAEHKIIILYVCIYLGNAKIGFIAHWLTFTGIDDKMIMIIKNMINLLIKFEPHAIKPISALPRLAYAYKMFILCSTVWKNIILLLFY